MSYRDATLILFDRQGRIHGNGVSSNMTNPKSTAVERPEGTREHWHRGRLHREDGPAIEFAGTALRLRLPFGDLRLAGPADLWFRRGRLHREGEPAVRDAKGSALWFTDGRVHREGGPAVEDVDDEGTNLWWFREGTHHRDDGPAFVHDGLGTEWSAPESDLALAGKTEIWVLEGKLHRDGGPAVTDSEGSQRWYRQGKLHREDGPAIINDPAATAGVDEPAEAWYLNGRPVADGREVARE